MRDRHQLVLSALLGGTAVALGAFAAHGLADDARAARLVETAVRYQMWHALALLAVAALRLRALWAVYAWLVGIVLFSGSLYALALGAPGWIGLVTPLGGAAYIVGWAALAVAAWRGGVRRG